jgi:hypothetical protein
MTCYSSILSPQSQTIVETGSISVINQSFQDNYTNQIADWISLNSSSLQVGNVAVRLNGIWNTASIDDDFQSEAVGVVERLDIDTAKIVYKGIVDFAGVPSASLLIPGAVYYLSVSGQTTTIEPSISKPIYIALTNTTACVVNMRGHVNSNQVTKTLSKRADIPCRPSVYYSNVISLSCPIGTYGLPITIERGQFSSSISLEDANNQAYDYLETFTSSMCVPVYFSEPTILTCPTDAPVKNISASYGSFYSFISVDDATSQSINYLETILSSGCYPPQAPIVSNGTIVVSSSAVINYHITASHNPTRYSASHLPPNLSINTSSGLISGSLSNYSTFYSSSIYAFNNIGSGSGLLTINPSQYYIPLGGAPASPTFANNGLLYIAENSPAQIEVYNPSSRTVTSTITGFPYNYSNAYLAAILFNPLDGFIYQVINATGGGYNGNGYVVKINTNTNTIVGQVELVSGFIGIGVVGGTSAVIAGNKIVIAGFNQITQWVGFAMVDLSTFSTSSFTPSSIQYNGFSQGICYNPNNSTVYSVLSGGSSLDTFDICSMNIETLITGSINTNVSHSTPYGGTAGATSIGYSPIDNCLYVAKSFNSSSIIQYNLSNSTSNEFGIGQFGIYNDGSLENLFYEPITQKIYFVIYSSPSANLGPLWYFDPIVQSLVNTGFVIGTNEYNQTQPSITYYSGSLYSAYGGQISVLSLIH